MTSKIHLNNSTGYALCIAILPVVMMYKIPIINIGVSTALLIAGMFYALCVLLMRKQKYRYETKAIWLFALYYAYALTKSPPAEIILSVAIIVHFMAISKGAVNVEKLNKYFVVISEIAAVATIIQYVVHLVFGFHIPLIAVDLCLEEMEMYRNSITTGINLIERGMYRPSAFFLEPSHMANYCSIGLSLCLFGKKPDYKKAIIITMGVIASTSGMGIVMMAGVWCAFPLLSSKGLSVAKVKRIVLLAAAGVLCLIILWRIPAFQKTLSRITGGVEYDANQYNALWGRTLHWTTYIAPMTGTELLFGYGAQNVPAVYFTGLMKLIYCYGIVGAGLFFLALIVLMFSSKSAMEKMLTVAYIALQTVANLTGLIFIVYYVGFLIANCTESKKRPNVQHDMQIQRRIHDE